jgi:hypothetical protein
MPIDETTMNLGDNKMKLYYRSGSVIDSSDAYQGYLYYRRVYLKRAKPRLSFLNPTDYDLSIQSHEVGTYRKMFSPSFYLEKAEGHPGEVNGMFSEYFTTSGTARSFPSFSNNHLNGVITDLRLKIKDQSVNFAQAWAERHRTMGLLSDSISRIARSIQYLRRGNWRKANSLLKLGKKAGSQAPASWLEYQYGWTPLLNDVYGSMEALRQLREAADWGVSVKTGRKFETSSQELVEKTTLGGKARLYVKVKTFQGVFGRIDYQPTNDFFSVLASNTGVTNPALVAWELVPYSFVFDWGAQVGNWISSLDATQYMSFMGGSYTDRRERNLSVEPEDTSDIKWKKLGLDPSGRRFELHRKVWSSFPIANAPRIKDPLSVTHVANALSLLAEAMKRGPVKFR